MAYNKKELIVKFENDMQKRTRWLASGVVTFGTEARTDFCGGAVALSGVLDRVRVTTVNGTDTFDAGQINVLYEG